jgi:hypothetical protein
VRVEVSQGWLHDWLKLLRRYEHKAESLSPVTISNAAQFAKDGRPTISAQPHGDLEIPWSGFDAFTAGLLINPKT